MSDVTGLTKINTIIPHKNDKAATKPIIFTFESNFADLSIIADLCIST